MLVLAPDPRLGIAPERVARVRGLLAAASGDADGGEADAAAAALPGVPGVVVVLPGGADGVLDALVLRPDGVLGLAPTPVRESVGAGAPLFGPDTSATPERGGAEIDRLLALPDPACAAPRRLLSSAGPDHAEDTRAALTAPVGPAHGCGADDVRRLLTAFRLGDHVPDAAELARAGFLAEHPSRPPTPTGSSPAIPLPAVASSSESRGGPAGPAPTSSPAEDAPAIPEARRAPRADPGSAATGPAADPGAPATAPLPAATASGSGDLSGLSNAVGTWRATGRVAAASEPGAGGGHGAAGRAGDPRPGLPATGRLSALAAPGSVVGTSRRGRARLRDRVLDRLPDRLPGWAAGYRGLAVAAVAAFLVALGLALLTGRVVTVTGGGDAAVDPAATQVLDGVPFTRASAASDPTCEGHAYGQAAQFLRERPCLTLDRALWTGTVDGRSVVLSVAAVRMADPTSAAALRSLVDTPGTGNVADLLREGRGYPGAPERLTNAGYASAQLGDRVLFVEADRVSGATMTENELDDLSRTGLALRR